MPPDVLLTDRLELRPLGLEGVQALIDRDAIKLSKLFGTDPTMSIASPPEMDDALPFIADAIRNDPSAETWWAWILIRRDDRAFVGSAGFGGPPDESGTIVVGYAVFPAFEGQGFASEATRSLTGWALSQADARRVRATIPPSHAASIRVAEKSGFLHVGEAIDAEVGRVLVWEAAST